MNKTGTYPTTYFQQVPRCHFVECTVVRTWGRPLTSTPPVCHYAMYRHSFTLTITFYIKNRGDTSHGTTNRKTGETLHMEQQTEKLIKHKVWRWGEGRTTARGQKTHNTHNWNTMDTVHEEADDDDMMTQTMMAIVYDGLVVMFMV